MTRDEAEHKKRLAGLGCMLCRRLFGITDSPAEFHHLREGGWGKGGYKTLIPLCPAHHRLGDGALHHLGTKGFVRKYGVTQRELLDDTLRLLGEAA